MFGRIMAVVVAVIVLLTSVLSGLGLYTLTSRQTAIRQENLRAEAREIAYLASLYSGGSSTYTLGTSLFSGSAQNTVALKHLRWKAAQVYDEYGAYIAIVDRSGQVMDNMAVTYEKNPDFAKTLNGKDIYEALLTIIGGDEISIRRQVDGDWYFTVGVPFVSGGLVRGAVSMYTSPAHCLPPPTISASADFRNSGYAAAGRPIAHAHRAYMHADRLLPCSVRGS